MVARMAGRDVLGRTWFDQACADLAAAEDSAATGHHEWACFQAQQAGEKALKAVLRVRGRTSILTNSVRRLVHACAADDDAFRDLDDDARWLDQHYIPTRYPNGLDAETPSARYEAKDSERCLRTARSILDRAGTFFAN